jgi:hypothetical protein
MKASKTLRKITVTHIVPLLMILSAGMLVGVLPARADVMLWNQPTDLSQTWASQYDPIQFQNFGTVYDNFTLGSASSITGVEWVGAYFNPPAAGPITSFEVQFWSDAAGQPGISLADYVIPGNASETFLSNDNLGSPAYTYAVGLGTPFDAAAGTQYWLSVVADLAFPPQWGWETGTGGDGTSFQDFFGSRSPIGNDMAFTLRGVEGIPPVPEPASVGLLGLGLISSGFIAWRRRRQ